MTALRCERSGGVDSRRDPRVNDAMAKHFTCQESDRCATRRICAKAPRRIAVAITFPWPMRSTQRQLGRSTHNVHRGAVGSSQPNGHMRCLRNPDGTGFRSFVRTRTECGRWAAQAPPRTGRLPDDRPCGKNFQRGDPWDEVPACAVATRPDAPCGSRGKTGIYEGDPAGPRPPKERSAWSKAKLARLTRPGESPAHRSLFFREPCKKACGRSNKRCRGPGAAPDRIARPDSVTVRLTVSRRTVCD